MHIFYSTDISGDTGQLDDEESRHAVKVLRMKEGDQLPVVDGLGNFYVAEITNPSHKRCEFKVIERREESKKGFSLAIAIAPTKNLDRLEWFVEKVTEIGIDEIIPIECKNSERKVLKTERLVKKAVSAMKQSQKASLPEISELTKVDDLLRSSFEGEKYIAHCYDKPKEDLKDVYKAGSNTLILIGPEGDFTQEEVEEAIKNGFKPVNLSSSRLRTETAGIVACCAINLANGC